ncbi:ribosome small subunit-dependent GTPase A [Aerococcus sanguinicola]|uniref:Small ribosomal subunit biogenesis GTPase RsgA n=1 Tax=Aerococcus sanguinicola TaxID=119206 RepID=A0A0X8FA34_9LACT|nr:MULTISPECIES: ribosome small subunit-dependent GTPase A [Aerococcus]AMB93575.1 ribosome biogenesis GTPase RsgA [Aerococcus sanguinicola]MDK7050795.1 ribosome small subunit-dependent GTPase A [Aerococcus sanguinicola]OFT97967.1 ribosome small subunit-dependent GTPase A [Aerococcus sp. HMSC23C02]PKZ21697.1 ribosome small subunit-dependent GTPase A [Aerococcus sanguinicola]
MTKTDYQGQIVHALSGFYYVEEAQSHQRYETRARGQFRKTKTSPLVGDYVRFIADHDREGLITEVLPRKNQLQRPPVANVDLAFLVVSVKEPSISPKLLDRFLAYLAYEGIEVVLYFSKLDLLSEDEEKEAAAFMALYQDIGYKVFRSDALDLADLESLSQDQTMVVVGQSGVGKSTLLNRLLPELDLETAEVSKSLGRGRHTTRDVQLHDLLGGKFLDTPGFSSIDLPDMEAAELTGCFPDIAAYAPACKFRGCLHLKEPKCAVKAALAEGEIAESRYASYSQLLDELANRKPKY